MFYLLGVWMEVAHQFSHRVLHPAVFGCSDRMCGHSEQAIRPELFSPIYWMRRFDRFLDDMEAIPAHIKTVERIEQNLRK